MISSKNIRKIALSFGVVASTTSLLFSGQASAQTLESTDTTSIGASATFNNSWAQTFEATGTLGVDGGAHFKPFAAVEHPISLPNSGLAELSATVTGLSKSGGSVEATAFIDATSSTNNLTLNADEHVGLGSLTITPDTAADSTIGASVIGTNIGTDEIQVTGVRTRSVINDLSAFDN